MYRTIRTPLLALGLALIAGSAHADEPEGEICAPFKDGVVDETLLEGMLSAAREGQLFRIDESSSRVGFCVNSALQRIEGNFEDFSGGISLDMADDNTGQTMVLIRSASLQTTGILVRHLLLGDDFFDVKDYPEILFVSRSLEWTGTDTAQLRGDLTLRGITRPVTFRVTLTPSSDEPVDVIVVEATTTIDREAFGMESLKGVADSAVNLCISAKARRYAQQGGELESVTAATDSRSTIGAS